MLFALDCVLIVKSRTISALLEGNGSSSRMTVVTSGPHQLHDCLNIKEHEYYQSKLRSVTCDMLLLKCFLVASVLVD